MISFSQRQKKAAERQRCHQHELNSWGLHCHIHCFLDNCTKRFLISFSQARLYHWSPIYVLIGIDRALLARHEPVTLAVIGEDSSSAVSKSFLYPPAGCSNLQDIKKVKGDWFIIFFNSFPNNWMKEEIWKVFCFSIVVVFLDTCLGTKGYFQHKYNTLTI